MEYFNQQKHILIHKPFALYTLSSIPHPFIIPSFFSCPPFIPNLQQQKAKEGMGDDRGEEGGGMGMIVGRRGIEWKIVC